MGAVSETCPIGEAAVRTAAAGHDLLLVCHTEPAQRAAAEALVARLSRAGGCRSTSARRPPSACASSGCARSARREGGPPVPEPDGRPLAKAMATRAVTEVGSAVPGARARAERQRARRLPALLRPGARASPSSRRSPTSAAGSPPPSRRPASRPRRPSWASSRVRRRSPTPPSGRRPPTPRCSSSTTRTCTRRTARCSRRCRPRARCLAVVLLRDPYDAALLAPGVRGLTAYGWRACQMEAVVARLTHP